MTTLAEPIERPTVRQQPPAAVVYVDATHAVVVKTTTDGAIAVTDIKRRLPEDLSYLARIADEVGERGRVAIVGPDDLRLELEREYVMLYRRPDLLVDVEPGGAEPADRLIERLEQLAS